MAQLVRPMNQEVTGQFCDYCNSQDPRKAHPVTNAIDGSERWWQSPPLSSGTRYNQVNVTLDLGQLFHVAYVLIKFANSPRPDLWVLERSVDFGSTYSPWQYFAHSKADCWQQFGRAANTAITRDDDVLCTTDYSRVVPLENGEVVVSLINGRPGARNFTFSNTLREFTQATNIRLRFLRTNTLLGHLISKAQRDPTVTRRYYYSIKDISVGGRCACNGHADVCSADNPEKVFRCECRHHTCGETCDRCCPGHHQRRWQLATWGHSHECEACNCHGHAADCFYDPDVERQQASLDIRGVYAGGGVCINCQHNTAGINCEQCAKGYFRPHGVPVEAPHGCIPCSCSPEHADGCEPGSGRCACRPNFHGDHCEECAPGYHNFPLCSRIPVFPVSAPSPEDPGAGDIKGCDCDFEGVLPEICDAHGRCLCRPGVEGPRCAACRQGFYSFPICQACQCSALGSYPTPCSPATGQCECRPGIAGRRCDRCLSGAPDFPHCSVWRSPSAGGCPWVPLAQGRCLISTECRCHVAGTVSGIGECGQRDGDCHCKPHVGGDSCDTCDDGYFALEKGSYFGCQGCRCDVGGAVTPMCSGPAGVCVCREHVVGKACQRPEDNHYFADLHHTKYELEDGTTPSGRDLRFGFDPLEFPGFSWRGYAQMTPLQHQICIIPIEEFSTEYLKPQVRCIASYGPLANQRATCLSVSPETPPAALILDAPPGGPPPLPPQDPSPSTDVVTGITMEAPQSQVTLRGRVPRPGRYVIVIHFYQPAHPAFPVEVSVDGGRRWPGVFRASFCPHVLGCQDQAITGDQAEFTVWEPEVAVTVKVPEGKSLVLVRVCVPSSISA
ncbi:Laminin subunit alpha-3 [Myotis brandtii]|uniref:Laminin subunit alpha-3 n=1 Tax=Myotis brandtii TaxID=109478 RepID=S7N954_MYOBR|nr:Laminin subunit alpha-3 [Myotis brandtii]